MTNQVSHAKASTIQRLAYIDALEMKIALLGHHDNEKTASQTDFKTKNKVRINESKLCFLKALESLGDAKCTERELRQKILELEFFLEQVRLDLVECHVVQAQLQRSLSERTTQRDALAQNATVLVGRVDSLTRSLNFIGAENGTILTSSTEMETTLNDRNKRLSDSLAAIDKYQIFIAKSEQDKSALEARIAELEGDLRDVTTKCCKEEESKLAIVERNYALIMQVEEHVVIANQQNRIVQSLQNDITDLHKIIKELQCRTETSKFDEHALSKMIDEKILANVSKLVDIQEMNSRSENVKRTSLCLVQKEVPENEPIEDATGENTEIQVHKDSPVSRPLVASPKVTQNSVKRVNRPKKQVTADVVDETPTKQVTTDVVDEMPMSKSPSCTKVLESTPLKRSTRGKKVKDLKEDREEAPLSSRRSSRNKSELGESPEYLAAEVVNKKMRNKSKLHESPEYVEHELVNKKKRKLAKSSSLFSAFVDKPDFKPPKLKSSK